MLIYHNRLLSGFLEAVEKRTEEASSLSDLDRIVEAISEFAKEEALEFNNSLGWTLIVLVPASLALIWYLEADGAVFLLVIGCIANIVIYLATIHWGNKRIRDLSDTIYTKSVLIQNSLTELYKDGESEYRRLRKLFNDFSRGDEDQKITRLIEGKIKVGGTELLYRYYQFRYVEVTTTTETDDDGFTHETKERTTCHRYGILTDFPYTANLTCWTRRIPSYFRQRWRSCSPEFNESWKVRAGDLMTAARFFKPAVVLEFNRLADNFKGVNFEVSGNGEMCVSFDEDILPSASKKTITDPAAFRKVILSNLKVKKLRVLFTILANIKRYND